MEARYKRMVKMGDCPGGSRNQCVPTGKLAERVHETEVGEAVPGDGMLPTQEAITRYGL